VGTATIPCPTGMFPFGDPGQYGDYVHVSCWESEVTNTGTFAVMNVSNPTSPSLIASAPVTPGYHPISFAISGHYLYVVATQGGSTSNRGSGGQWQRANSIFDQNAKRPWTVSTGDANWQPSPKCYQLERTIPVFIRDAYAHFVRYTRATSNHLQLLNSRVAS
jgi:hypothetical protein